MNIILDKIITKERIRLDNVVSITHSVGIKNSIYVSFSGNYSNLYELKEWSIVQIYVDDYILHILQEDTK